MELGICAHIPGRVVRIEVGVGDSVAVGDSPVVLEAMGVEMPVEAARGGRVTRIDCVLGQGVREDDVLVLIDDGTKRVRPPTRSRPRKPPSPVAWTAIQPVPGSLKVTKKDLDALEAEFGDLPPGYRDFMMRFGAAEFGGILGVYTPDQVRKTTADRRPFFREHLLEFEAHVRLATLQTKLWANANDVLVPDDIARLVVIAHATAGDLATLAFVSGSPERLLRFQRPSMKSVIEDVGPTFAHAIAKYFEDLEDDE
jgi:pyruvate/2-oxoglutarate dehydrogenase complex dihydrolipoamide acyltransferase (E2) component